MNLAVFASGTGSILTSMLEHELVVDLVLVDRACVAEQIASGASIPVVRCERKSFGADFDRVEFTDGVIDTVDDHSIDVVAMAGFGTILSGPFFSRLSGRVLNTHPALLPSFKGWHAVRDALDAGVKVTGCTVHIATEAVDDGPILAQEPVPVFDDDDEASLHERIKAVERELYPATIKTFVAKLESTMEVVT